MIFLSQRSHVNGYGKRLHMEPWLTYGQLDQELDMDVVTILATDPDERKLLHERWLEINSSDELSA